MGKKKEKSIEFVILKETNTFYRMETHLNKADFKSLKKMKVILGATTLVSVMRHSLRLAYVILTQVSEGKDVYLIDRKNPRDKTRIKIL